MIYLWITSIYLFFISLLSPSNYEIIYFWTSASIQTLWCTFGWCCPSLTVSWRWQQFELVGQSSGFQRLHCTLRRIVWLWTRLASSAKSGGKDNLKQLITSCYEAASWFCSAARSLSQLLSDGLVLPPTGRWSSWCFTWRQPSFWLPPFIWQKLRLSQPSSILLLLSNKVNMLWFNLNIYTRTGDLWDNVLISLPISPQWWRTWMSATKAASPSVGSWPTNSTTSSLISSALWTRSTASPPRSSSTTTLWRWWVRETGARETTWRLSERESWFCSSTLYDLWVRVCCGSLCVSGPVSSSGWDVQTDRRYRLPLQQGLHAARRPVQDPAGPHRCWERGQMWVKHLM